MGLATCTGLDMNGEHQDDCVRVHIAQIFYYFVEKCGAFDNRICGCI